MPTGWIIAVLILFPNIFYLLFPPIDIPPETAASDLSRKKTLEIIEKVGQAGCFTIPFFYSINTSSKIEQFSFVLFGLALIFYYAGWLRYLLQGRSFRILFSPIAGIPLPMALAPITAFFAAAVILHAWPLALAALILSGGHIPVSWLEWQRSLGVKVDEGKLSG